MPYNPDIHHRRSIRLKHYNYTEEGAYFVTLCTKNKQCIFGDVKQGKMRLNALGAIAYKYWQEIPQHFDHINLDVFVIMPNHVHGILWITKSLKQVQQNSKFGKIIPGSISSVIRSYKAAVTQKINEICQQKGTSLVWQRNYYEHINRSEKSLQEIRKYIVENPLNWKTDPEHSLSREILLDLPF